MLLNLYIYIVSIVFIYMTVWFVLSILLKRNDIADIAWGLGFITVALALYLKQGVINIYFPIIFLLTILWGFRLSIHILLRNLKKKEDFRYKAWREEWGNWFYIRTYLQVFLLQGFFMTLISLPIMVTAYIETSLKFNLISYIGVLVWILGFFFESIGDYQLSKFLKDSNNKGRIMTSGLWRYTRHPNYFGEVSQWWGIFIIVSTLPYSYISVIAPLTISFLIIKVSGIPMLEKAYDTNKEFQAYKLRTNALFPWFEKKC